MTSSCAGDHRRDVTDLFHRYQECARHIWNASFLPSLSKATQWDTRDLFEDVCVLLFKALILMPLGHDDADKRPSYHRDKKCLHFLRIEPAASSGTPIRISREEGSERCWDHPYGYLRAGELDLRFVDFFDFDVLGQRQFEFYRARIVESTVDPALIGRDALVQVNAVRIRLGDE